ncbi:putative ABC transport system ATP-binding protein [Amycolatopsis arida]|uniref:Putative ABC transport system ATP-binding protein n=1 Tax=Amycolatopsis arida TaxID=587909 RepID=A0A1I5ZG21_9PSEU|nr:ATP-binding cassette domain-containing protein [Amycolatopsis arida]TDX89643.1 putative ABC transport system ATP-binding protein [Amycolatopsis arida]SFQ55370.1 putative ABC transport system ATP-binding protein [Amycolatopsis arida]
MAEPDGTARPALHVAGLRRWFRGAGGDVHVLRGLELGVAAGELVTVAGRSGSGKSSLLALLGGLDAPDAGTVLCDGEPVGPVIPWHRCAVLPQSLGLADELTLAENVALPLRLRPDPRRRDAAAVADRVRGLLAELGIAELADRYPAETSFGQRQRAALARAVAARPRVLLADEPTAHLDVGSVPAVLGLLRRCADEGGAVVVATHDEEVHRIADRRVRLREGRLVES